MKPRNKIVAALLAFIGGTIGAHKIYLRDSGGIIFFFFLFVFSMSFKFPLTMLLGILDGIKLLNMNDQEFNKRYNRGFVQSNPVIERRREAQMNKYEMEDKSRQYGQKVVRKPRTNPFKASGMAKYKEFDIEGAILDFERGLDIDQEDIALNFNLACAYSLTEKKDLAFKHLNRAVILGFNDTDRIITHDDLAYLRIQPEFDAFKKSGFKVLPTSTTQDKKVETVSKNTGNDELVLSQLKRLDDLKDRGILSEEEFMLEQKKLLRQ